MLIFINQFCLQEVALDENTTNGVPQNSVKLDKKRHHCQHHLKCKNKTNNYW